MGTSTSKPRVRFDPIDPEYPLKIFWQSAQYDTVCGYMLCVIREDNKIEGHCHYHPKSYLRPCQIVPFSLEYKIEDNRIIARSPMDYNQQLTVQLNLNTSTGNYTSMGPLDVGHCYVQNLQDWINQIDR